MGNFPNSFNLMHGDVLRHLRSYLRLDVTAVGPIKPSHAQILWFSKFARAQKLCL